MISPIQENKKQITFVKVVKVLAIEMPAPFSQTDLSSSNQPSALLELSFQLQATELTIPEETRPNNVAITVDAEEGTASITATLPVTFSLDASGKPVLTATDYIP